MNLGCKVNRAEADSITAALVAHGAERAGLKEADLVVVTTCTVTSAADAKSRKAVRRAAHAPARPWVIVTGCAVALDDSQFRGISQRVRLLPDKAQALKESLALLNLAAPSNNSPLASRFGAGFNTRASILVQDGCNKTCSYCVVPQARGPARSLPPADILAQFEQALAAGCRELVLSGIDLGAYHAEGLDLPALLLHLFAAGKKIVAASRPLVGSLCAPSKQVAGTLCAPSEQPALDFRVRLSSLEPLSISDALLALMVAHPGRLCAHLHVPLQSGSKSVLAAMCRGYSLDQYTERLLFARRLVPQLALSTDVIVGFPGETDADFEQSLALCRQLGFCRVHAFRYSRRPLTPASELPGQIDSQTMRYRSRVLRTLTGELAAADAARRIGSSEWVLVGTDGLGRSDSYHEVELAVSLRSTLQPGRLYFLRFSGYRNGKLLATAQVPSAAGDRNPTSRPPANAPTGGF
jgi:threonylcarbamoyladenosine tRNA methylthiotransferase MtaB